MCRSIKILRGLEPPATKDECHAAALQYVRKVSGYRKPSKANEAIFDAAVEQIAAATRSLLKALPPSPTRERQDAWKPKRQFSEPR